MPVVNDAESLFGLATVSGVGASVFLRIGEGVASLSRWRVRIGGALCMFSLSDWAACCFGGCSRAVFLGAGLSFEGEEMISRSDKSG